MGVTLESTPGSYLPGAVLGYGGETTIEGPADVVAQLRRRFDPLQRLQGRRIRADGEPAPAR